MKTVHICGDCLHFRQHCMWVYGVYDAIDFGHCVAKRKFRYRTAHDSPCSRWEPQDKRYAEIYGKVDWRGRVTPDGK